MDGGSVSIPVQQQTPSAQDDLHEPRRSSLPFPVVGLGASAGGVAAALRFFEHMPGNSGMAFVVVLHLSPQHESSVAAILQRATRMPVLQVTETVPIEADHVYVIAPAMQLSMDDGQLRVSSLQRVSGKAVAVDLFFRTLAQAHGERAIAVVLSGTGSDGSVGLADMKREGGVTIAQAPADAEYDGMPSAALDTRLVDFVLPAAEIPGKLLELWRNATQIELPGAKALGAKAEEPSGPRTIADAEDALRDVMAILHARTGNDLQHYKLATVLRRLERRMQVTGQPHLPAYRDYLERHPEESEPLLQDMLISVTSFFRDREAFEALEREIMGAWSGWGAAPRQWRGWVVGCATGEEAYSLAMLVNDHAHEVPPMSLQFFASDINETALKVAREGVYPEAILTDVPPVRLREYFEHEAGAYRVKRALREQVTFSRHNLLRDPPFSRVDLISCRNLLIYLERDVQARALDVFHFALKPGGLLLLGSAETADWMSDLFTVVDKKHRIYRANSVRRSLADLLPLRADASPAGEVRTVKRARTAAGRQPERSATQPSRGREADADGPSSVLVDRDQKVLCISRGASHYLRQAEGAPTRNLMDLIRPELAAALHPALLHCLHTGQSVMAQPLSFDGGRGAKTVQISVRPDGGDQAGALVVSFEEFDASLAEPAEGWAQARDPALAPLEEEIRRLREQMSGMLGDSMSSDEALRASNEELQSINEELRSATEELETSKEELQSVNEELTTVNYELKCKVEETAKAIDDLTNLIASMDIATLFVDRALRIKRFTHRASEIFNILTTDVGRPLGDLTHRLEYEDLGGDVAQVLAKLQSFEREVRGQGERWFLVRISPYRTGEDRIDGAVLNFIDVTERRKVQEQLRANDERLRVVATSTRDYAIITMDAGGRITSWNKGAELMFGYAEDEMRGEHFGRLFVPEDQAAGQPEQELQQAREKGRVLDERWHLRKDGRRFFASGTTVPIADSTGPGFAKIARDLTERQLLERQRDELLRAEKKVREQLETAHAMRSEFLAIMSHELKNPLNLILMNAELIGHMPESGTSARLARAVDIIRRTVHSQSQIIDDLLDLSRLNTGKLTLNRTAVRWRLVAERIVDAVRQEAHSKHIEVSCTLEDLVIYADAVRVEQIIWNLISNAVKFTPSGGRVEVRLMRDRSFAKLEVSDTGTGIEAAAIHRVFNMFEQAEGDVSTRREGGLGIGLALVKQLTDLHEGRVEARSAGRDQGATFTVWLPLFEGRLAGGGWSSPMTLVDQRVLLVEDDLDTLQTLCEVLKTEGAVVRVASNAHDALAQADAGDFDLVISDVAMPGMDGLQMIAELRRRPHSAHWPAIAVTGFGRPDDEEKAQAAGFDVHLTKPLSLDALHEVCGQLLERKS
jgi:two-component system CheB/CheR fusion protein